MSRISSTLALAVVFLAASPAHAGYYPLWNRISHSGFANIVTVATADFNGDGRPDVVVRRNGPHNVLLYLTAADGTLGTPSTVHTGTNMTDLLVADATGDGKADVLLMESANALLVLPSNGNGTFGTPVTTALAFSPNKSAAADFTGDGKVDVMVRGGAEAAVALYAGDGAGGFSLVSNRPLPSPTRMIDAADIDDDGNADFIVAYSDATPYQVYFGRGDGSFEDPVEVSTIAGTAMRLITADLDADGDREILVLHFAENTLTIALNDGGRAFAAPVVRSVVPAPSTAGNPIDMVVTDFNGDGHADVAVTLFDYRLLATFTGTGDGSLNAGVFVGVGSTPSGFTTLPRYLAAADFDGDGRADLALAGNTSLATWRNVSGDLTLRLDPENPTITQGQTTRFWITVTNAQDPWYTPGSLPPPTATGTITLKRGDVEVATYPLNSGGMWLETANLPLGTHAMTAHYSGDGSYRPAVSPAVEQRVVAEAVTVTLTSSAAGTEVPYRELFHITVNVTSPLAGALDGELVLYRDDVEVGYGHTGPESSWSFQDLGAGTHTFRAEFKGSATQPPGKSGAITQVVKKANPVVTFEYAGDMLLVHGRAASLGVLLRGSDGGQLGGNVHLYSGATRLATVVAATGSNPSVSFPLALPVGVHYLYAVYDGDANFEPGQTGLKKVTVIPDQALFIHGSIVGSAITIQSVYTMPSGAYCRLHWKVGNGAWNSVMTSYPAWTEPQAPIGVPYTVRFEVYSADNQLLTTSNTEVVMRVAFTDDPLTSRTRIKALHLTELVAATNTLRAVAGLGQIDTFGMARGARIRASHVLQIQTAINEARRALGGDAVAFNGGIGTRTRIKASHIHEAREAIR